MGTMIGKMFNSIVKDGRSLLTTGGKPQGNQE
jgi:hypothetical protein